MSIPLPFSIVQWNIRGIRQKRNWLHCFPFFSADVFVFQETFLGVGDSFSFPQKVIFRNDRLGRGGGLLIAVNCAFPSSVVSFANLESPDVEVLSARIWTGAQWLTIVNLYAPEGKVRPSWLNILIRQLRPPFLILGDFNQKHRAWGNTCNSPGADLLHGWILDNDVCLLNSNHATHLAPSGRSSVIDLSLASSDLFSHCSFSVHHDSFDSDHLPISIQAMVTPDPASVRVTHTDWSAVNLDLDDFCCKAEEISVPLFHEKFATIKKSHSSRISLRRKDNPPWWDSSCAWLLGQKRRYFRLARNNFSRSYWLLFKQFAAKLRRCMKSKARAYWGSLCENASNGRIFQIYRSINNRVSKVQSHFVLEWDGHSEADRFIQAEAFADHFGHLSDLPGIPVDFSSSLDFWNRDFSISDLNAAIRLTKCTSPGDDGVPASSFKSLSSPSRLKLLNLYNRMVHDGSIPECWRTAVILPIWKNGRPKSQVSSYRPIALTAVGCKIMERMLLKRILDWTMEHNSFHARHFGFLPNKDCTKTLRILLKDIQDARRQKKSVVAVKLDIDSAYDSVWREGLIFKMAQMGIRGNVAMWIARWLYERWIKVRWRGCSSSRVGSARGVPQGSVLSPILFMIFMSDLFEIFDSGVQVLVYADDILIYCIGLCLAAVLRKLQEMLHRFQAWCDYWHLSVRADKCAAIHFSRSSAFPEDCLRLQGRDIAWNRSVKILGLTISYNLSFNAHFGEIQRKGTKRLNIIRVFSSVRWGVRTLDLLRMVNALIRSLIEYAAPLYSSASNSSLQILDRLYNAALRLATGLPRWTPILKLYRESGQVPLTFRRQFLSQVFFIRCVRSFHQSDQLQLYCPEDFQWQTGFGAIRPSMLIPSSWPARRITDFVEIFTNDFAFQSRSLPPGVICASFTHTILQHFRDFRIIATDASKDLVKTSIAALDSSLDIGRACLVHHINSVFTAEVLALDLGISLFGNHGQCLFLSDSKSALEALRNVHPKSPTAILHLFHTLRSARARTDRLILMWVPGHVGILANEKVDRLAKAGPFSLCSYGGIAPEDMSHHLRSRMQESFDDWWDEGKYAAGSRYLGPAIYRHTRSRREDVVTARLRTLSMASEYRLHRCRLISSPVCAICFAGIGTEYHYVFECRAFAAERARLSQLLRVSLSQISWNQFWSALEETPALFRGFIDLFLGSGRF